MHVRRYNHTSFKPEIKP